MADEPVVDAAASTDVPVATETPVAGTDTSAASDTTTTPAEGADQSTTPTEESFTKFDLKSLSREGLAAYKKLQADYTRARQADKAKYETLQQQLSSIQPLLSDPHIQAQAYFRQFGKYPDGYTAPTVSQPAQQENVIDPNTIEDPLMKKLYVDNMRLTQEAQARATRENQQAQETTLKGVKGFYEALSPAHKKLWQENLNDIRSSAEVFAAQGEKGADGVVRTIPIEKALKKAFNAACADKLYEMGKLDAVTAMKAKGQQPRPESGVNVAGGVVPGQFKTPEEAVRAAINSYKSS